MKKLLFLLTGGALLLTPGIALGVKAEDSLTTSVSNRPTKKVPISVGLGATSQATTLLKSDGSPEDFQALQGFTNWRVTVPFTFNKSLLVKCTPRDATGDSCPPKSLIGRGSIFRIGIKPLLQSQENGTFEVHYAGPGKIMTVIEIPSLAPESDSYVKTSVGTYKTAGQSTTFNVSTASIHKVVEDLMRSSEPTAAGVTLDLQMRVSFGITGR